MALKEEERWLRNDLPDPVFSGMVEDFKTFDETLQKLSETLGSFAQGVHELSAGLQSLSDGLAEELKQIQEGSFVREGCRLREAAQQIARPDAPHSALAKFDRNLAFNVTTPIKDHLANNERLRKELEKRETCLAALKEAVRQLELCGDLDEADRRRKMAQEELKASRAAFNRMNQNIFEWLYILEEHKGDIMDSCLQTLKHLQYDFFASAANSISNVLPQRMAFRPMTEMLPECLDAVVQRELCKSSDEAEAWRAREAFACRLLERLARENKDRAGAPPSAGPSEPVDPLSLSALLAHGFEEGQARRALRRAKNDTQAALEHLLGPEEAEEVRLPITGGSPKLPATTAHEGPSELPVAMGVPRGPS